MGKCDKLFPRNALLATTPPESQHMPKYVRGEVTKEAREELSRAAPTSASQCRRRHRAIPGAEFPEHVQLEPRRVSIARPCAARRANVGHLALYEFRCATGPRPPARFLACFVGGAEGL